MIYTFTNRAHGTSVKTHVAAGKDGAAGLSFDRVKQIGQILCPAGGGCKECIDSDGGIDQRRYSAGGSLFYAPEKQAVDPAVLLRRRNLKSADEIARCVIKFTEFSDIPDAETLAREVRQLGFAVLEICEALRGSK